MPQRRASSRKISASLEETMLHDMSWDEYTHKEKGTDKGRVQMKLLGDVDTFVLLSGDESDGPRCAEA